jgi:hypothetical protein
MKKSLSFLIAVSFLIVTSCKKPAGEGGNSSIKGKIWVTNWNSNFTTLINDYPGADQDVYIIYGDDASYGNKLKSGPDGVFEFKYLRTGKYKIYTYSKDKDAYLAGDYNAPKNAVIVETEITKKKSTVDIGIININD